MAAALLRVDGYLLGFNDAGVAKLMPEPLPVSSAPM
jgi:hypothetical protein